MIGLLILLVYVLVSPFKTQARLEAEIVLLRHQLSALRQRGWCSRPSSRGRHHRPAALRRSGPSLWRGAGAAPDPADRRESSQHACHRGPASCHQTLRADRSLVAHARSLRRSTDAEGRAIPSAKRARTGVDYGSRPSWRSDKWRLRRDVVSALLPIARLSSRLAPNDARKQCAGALRPRYWTLVGLAVLGKC
jgi:hypothetical protein